MNDGGTRRERFDDWLGRRGVVLAGALAAVALVALGLRIARAERPRGDTRFYREGARRFLAGENLYYHQPRGAAARDNTGYTYLPPFAPLSAWMVPLPYAAVRVVWLLLCVGCAWVTIERARGLGPRGPPGERIAVLLATLGVLRFGWNDLAHGQVNWITALLLAEVLRRREGAAAGAALGVALAIKPTAWPLVPFFLLLKRWRLVGACLATGGGLVLASLLRYGTAAPGLLGDWFALMRAFAADSAHAHANASLTGWVTRLLSGGQASTTDPITPLLFALPRETALGVGRGVALVVGLGLFALCVRRARREPGPAGAVGVLLVSALVSPVTWKAHLVVLIFPFLLLIPWLLRSPGWPRAVAGLITLALVLPSRALLGLQVGRVEAYGSLTLATLAMLGLLLCAPAPEPEP